MLDKGKKRNMKRKRRADGVLADNADSTLKMIYNGGSACALGGAAIMCHLIRSNVNSHGDYVELSFGRLESAPDLQQELRDLGCRGQKRVRCRDPEPESCERFSNETFDSDTYFDEAFADSISKATSAQAASIGASRSFIAQPSALMSMPAADMMSFLAGSGIVFCMRRFLVAASISSEKPLLAA
eukprot:gnl/TRDRNA2_/TRDRNA2_163355_c0_seq4.p1 gnl/TRDRNA2_/TRDRNA2_163355_c0~~gnl/TRDRNA2_/TRDRNA2_163355_c0_seq4.p1  ORF type:complete len:185 (-),score=27.27 gnl/TRDRNA2_/TRDRNA2_163355_c0_seq4:31-585(-)